MRYCGRYIVAALFLAYVPTVSIAQDKVSKPQQNSGDIAVKPLDELGSDGQTSLIHGFQVAPGDFPATFYSESTIGACTATLIGRRTILTAAHCVGDGKVMTVQIANSNPVKGTCTHHEDYNDGDGDISADYALCFMDKIIGGRDPEVLTLSQPKLPNKSLVLLAGYGCTKLDATGTDGKLRVGMAKLSKALGGTDLGASYFATFSDPSGTGAIICPGDSGGAVYQLLQKNANGKENPVGHRLVVGVNSRYGLDANELANGTSYLSATRAQDFKDFVKKWQTGKNAKICGIDESASRCRPIE